jgi:HSP20 family protein
MTLTRRPSPFGEFLSLRNAMDRFMDDAFFRPVSGVIDDVRTMPLDIYTTDDALVVEAALPAVKPENVDVSILGDTLTLTATTESERSKDNGGGYHLQEVRRGRFSRTVSLPSGLKSDAASASFENGLLRLSIPKAEQAKPRQIPITPVTEGQAARVNAGASAAGQSAVSSADTGSASS